jgi:hypothetical protein
MKMPSELSQTDSKDHINKSHPLFFTNIFHRNVEFHDLPLTVLRTDAFVELWMRIR